MRTSAAAGCPPTSTRIGAAEYNMIDRPYGTAGRFEKYRKLLSYSGNTFTRNWLVDEKENPTTGTRYAWVRARALGGKTNLWGRVALRMSDFDFKAASRDGFGVDWPISYADISPYYDKVDRLLGISGTKENIPQLPDSLFQRAHQAELRRADPPHRGRQDGPPSDSRARRRDHRRRRQQVPQPLRRPRPLRPRLQSQRLDAFADGADLSRARHRAT